MRSVSKTRVVGARRSDSRMVGYCPPTMSHNYRRIVENASFPAPRAELPSAARLPYCHLTCPTPSLNLSGQSHSFRAPRISKRRAVPPIQNQGREDCRWGGEARWGWLGSVGVGQSVWVIFSTGPIFLSDTPKTARLSRYNPTRRAVAKEKVEQ